VSDGSPRQLDLVTATPGEQLRAARLGKNLLEEDVAGRLNWLPSYVSIIERDDYSALRRPAFARGYVRAYGKLLSLDETALMQAFEALQGDYTAGAAARRVTGTRPAPLQRTGLGVVVGLVVLVLFLTGLWYWQGFTAAEAVTEVAPWSPDGGEFDETVSRLAGS
jgi:cytoskeleton protein RodZ